MKVWARFVGGALGGEERRIDFGPRYRVPVMPAFRLAETGTMSLRAPELDEYRLNHSDENGTYVYHWVRPDVEALREEIRELREEIVRLTRVPMDMAVAGWDLT